MARILLAWELGANLGHIDRQLGIAHALRERGHEPVFLLRDLSRAHARVVAQGYRLGQAPLWLPRLNQPPPLVTFANVLAGAGWLDAPGLAALISAWRTWFDLLQPDALVADHAPTALLAVRGSGIVAWACGSAFEVPPVHDGSFAPMLAGATAAACRRSDDALLQPVNAALALLGLAPLARLSEVFDGVHKALVTLPELAHYAGYETTPGEPVRWAGPMFAADRGAAAGWPEAPAGRPATPRVFAYLDPAHTAFEPLVRAIGALGVPTLVHAQGLAADVPQRLGTPTLRFEAAPVRMDQAMAGADLVVCHGGQGTMAAALLAGKPLLVIPTQPEQALAAQRVAAQGLGLADPPAPAGADAGGHRYRQMLQRLLHEPSFRAAAAQVAARHAGLAPERTAARVAQWVEESLGGAGGGGAAPDAGHG